jgi:hypothetical protein
MINKNPGQRTGYFQGFQPTSGNSFQEKHNVADYADLLHIAPKH